MKKLPKESLWVGLFLAVGLSLLWEFKPLPDARGRLETLPLTGLAFKGKELPLNEAENEIFRNTRVIKRLYLIGSQHVVILVIDGSGNRHAIHDPIYCFRGAGWTISENGEVAIPGGTAAMLSLEKHGQTIQTMHWFSDGSQRHASAPAYWWQTTLRRLSFGISGEEPLLVLVYPYKASQLQIDALFDQMPSLLDL